MTRSAGILLHPTSLPGGSGIGELGPEADRFTRVLEGMGHTWWQMLPVGPTGYADSPYQSPSTFAGNPLLVSFDRLVTDGLVDPERIAHPPDFPATEVAYGRVIPWRMRVLADVAEGFATVGGELVDAFEGFVERHREVWLEDFALFTALKRAHGLRPWWEWGPDLARRRPAALKAARRRLDARVHQVRVEQFLFDLHFSRLRSQCAAAGVRLIGDIPIFVAHDSADVWAHRELFHLDREGMPTVVAGVPPDYFAHRGQRWGNPLYRWERHRENGFAWWTARMRRAFELFDLVRIDHFRGFAASWHIPSSAATAVGGRWVPGPGTELFDHLLDALGDLPVIAEDLGVITPDVDALRDRYGFPGMKVLQFGFEEDSAHAVEKLSPDTIAYTGTHDNDTALGWFRDPRRHRERRRAMQVLGSDGSEFHWDMIEAVMRSDAGIAVIPLQDVLGLGSEARMNVPGTTSANWRWRFCWEQLTEATIRRMRRLVLESDRAPGR